MYELTEDAKNESYLIPMAVIVGIFFVGSLLTMLGLMALSCAKCSRRRRQKKERKPVSKQGLLAASILAGHKIPVLKRSYVEDWLAEGGGDLVMSIPSALDTKERASPLSLGSSASQMFQEQMCPPLPLIQGFRPTTLSHTGSPQTAASQSPLMPISIEVDLPRSQPITPGGLGHVLRTEVQWILK